MPQSIRFMLKDLIARHAFLAGARAHVDETTRQQIDAQLDDLQAQIDSLVEVHAK